jgi:hypothetical protein
MADLDIGKAKLLAGMLVTAGHPFAGSAILATASDLVRWCKGAVIDGRIVTPEQQAQALIDEVRTEWDGWPENGGTRQLLQLFRSKYSKVTLESPGLSLSEAVSRGLLAPPCPLCDKKALHCEYGGQRGHEVYQATIEHSAAMAKSRPAREPVTALTYEQMEQRAAAVYQDEQRRKIAQLEKLGCG